MNYLPTKLLKLRKHYNYSQAYLAEVLNIDVKDYMALENGRAVLNFEQCKKLASLYHVSVIEIFANSEKVTMYEVQGANTDELNIEYFLPKETFSQKIKRFIKENPILVGVIAGVLVIAIIGGIIIHSNANKSVVDEDYTPSLTDINRLAVSPTTVVYIDSKGNVKGSGDNANGQLSNLPSSGAIKVAEGSSFTVVLKDDGTLSSFGLIDKYKNEISKWKNLIDVAAGDNHIVAVDKSGKVYATGDNSSNQCDVDSFENITNVYATKNGTIVKDNTGELSYTGEFIGSSQVGNFKDIKDIDTSNDNLVVLTSDNKVDCIAKDKSFLNYYKWSDIVDVACGDNFIAALQDDGTVLIDTEDTTMEKDVSKWKNIIAIAASDEYLIAYDGSEIYGTGKNDYHQFKQEIIEKAILPQVTGINISVGSFIDVTFDAVDNAEGYEVKLLGEDGQTYRVSSNQKVSFTTDKLIKGESYAIMITALGDDENFVDSNPVEVDFVYDIEDSKEEEIQIASNINEMSVSDFEAYMKSLGVSVVGIENATACDGSESKIISIEGISANQRISKSDLANITVTYNY